MGSTGTQIPLPISCSTGSSTSSTCRSSYSCTKINTANLCCPTTGMRPHPSILLCNTLMQTRCAHVKVVCRTMCNTSGKCPSRRPALVMIPAMLRRRLHRHTLGESRARQLDNMSPVFSSYYYDRSSSRCRPFTWLGQGGNFNNFLSEDHCSAYCAKSEWKQ
jgi:hypothetical protein